MRKTISIASIAAILSTALISNMAMANARHLLPPVINRVPGHIVLPHQDSATLPLPVMHWLRHQGLRYIIPHVPAGFPPVKLFTAAQAAVAETAVGPSPTIRELALISPLTSISPMRAQDIYWAVVVSPSKAPRGKYFVTFIGVQTPTVLGSLLHEL